jgi:3-oxoacyl-[acyl-carrier protein] reductase
MKYAIVTGGTKGIGKQICIDLLIKGYFVITNYGNDDIIAKNTIEDFINYSEKFEVIKSDQSKDDDIKSFIDNIKKRTNKIHCIICNTGITLRKSFDTIENNEWEKVFKINVHSHFYLIRELNLLIQKKSRIVFIGSILAKFPHSTSLAYGVTKAAVHSLSKNLVKEFSERKITVNTIAPGFVETNWHNGKSSEIKNNIYNKTALGRFALVEEISSVLMMILENDFINGETISVDGGYNYK